jgi:hypothetical protein
MSVRLSVPPCEVGVTSTLSPQASSDGSPRRRKDARQGFPYGHACVSSALIGTGVWACARRLGTRWFTTLFGAEGGPGYDLRITSRGSPSAAQQAPTDDTLDVSRRPLTTLRGASVEVDARQAARVVVALCLTALGVVVVSLFVVGVHQNAQITRLRQQGVPVAVTVTGCRGLLGGSGSNAAGDSCSGTFVLQGRRYSATIPGDTLRAPGSTIRLVTVASDPGLLATVHQVQSEHASWRVFILPTVLLVVLAALVTAFALRRRRKRGDVGSVSTPLTAVLPRRKPLQGYEGGV